MDVIDRTRAKHMSIFIAAAVLHAYLADAAVRTKGEHIAAAIIIAFMRTVYVKCKILPMLRLNREGRKIHEYALKKAGRHLEERPCSSRHILERLGSSGRHVLERSGSGRCVLERSGSSSSNTYIRSQKLPPIITSSEPIQAVELLTYELPQAGLKAESGIVVTIQPVVSFDMSVSIKLTCPVDRLDIDSPLTSLHVHTCVLGAIESRHPLLCIYMFRASKAANCNAITERVQTRFASCVALPYTITCIARDCGYDYQLMIDQLAPLTTYQVLLEVEEDVCNRLRGTSAGAGADKLCAWEKYSPCIFRNNNHAFWDSHTVYRTPGRAPSVISDLVTVRQYASKLSPQLRQELHQRLHTVLALPLSSSRSLLEAKKMGYELFYTLSAFGRISHFSCLLQTQWTVSNEDLSEKTVYDLQRRLLLCIDRDLLATHDPISSLLQRPALVTSSCTLVPIYVDAWADIKCRVPGQTQGKEEKVTFADYLSSVSLELQVLREMIEAVIRRLYAHILSQPSAPMTAVNDFNQHVQVLNTGVSIFAQYRARVHNSYGSSAFSSVKLADGRGLCELAQVQVSQDSLLSVGKHSSNKQPRQHDLLTKFTESYAADSEENGEGDLVSLGGTHSASMSMPDNREIDRRHVTGSTPLQVPVVEASSCTHSSQGCNDASRVGSRTGRRASEKNSVDVSAKEQQALGLAQWLQQLSTHSPML